MEGLLIFLLKIFKNSLNELSFSGVLILPLKINEIKYKPNLSCIIYREVVLPCIITFPILRFFCI